MAVRDIFNFVEVDEQIATGGQPTEEQFQAARDEGYEAVINLAPGDTKNRALPSEKELLESLGLEYFHIPMPWSEPTLEHFTSFCAAMEKLDGKKVLVHCAANYRVTAVVSSYAIKHMGWSTEQADGLVAKIWASNPEFEMDEVWQSYIETIRG